MSTPRVVRVAVVAAVCAGLISPSAGRAAYPRPSTFQMVSVSSTGQAGNADSGWGAVSGETMMGMSMSSSGRFVAFASSATNLVPGDINRLIDVFVRDRKSGTTQLASVPDAASPVQIGVGLPTCSGSYMPAISADGRYLAFASCDINLIGVGKDTNLADDIFLRDMKTGTTTRVSVASNGDQSNIAGNSYTPSISADGRYIAFVSQATNFASVCPPAVVGDSCSTTAGMQVYVHDVKTGTTRLVSATPAGEVANGASFDATVSRDGRYVAFVTYANNLAGNDTNVSATNFFALPSAPDVYLKDLRTGAVRLVSVALSGQAPEGGAYPESGYRTSPGSRTLAISADDRYVTFGSSATDLVPNGAGGGIFVRDLVRNRTERVSVSSAGQSFNGLEAQGGCGVSHATSSNSDGRYVAMNCAPDPTCGNGDQYTSVYDRLTGALQRVSLENNVPGTPDGCAAAHGPPTGDFEAVLSGDGRSLAFASDRATLVRGDTQKNSNGSNALDVFVADRGVALGVGGLVGRGTLSVTGADSFATTGLASGVDTSSDVDTALTAAGANLIGASLAYRAKSADLFLRLELQQMPMFALANPAIVYGLDFTVGQTPYQLRISKAGLDASYELFRRDAAGWVHAADLHGGYGTTGQEVVAALSLAAIGAQQGARLSNVAAFTGLGSLPTGAFHAVDRMSLGAG